MSAYIPDGQVLTQVATPDPVTFRYGKVEVVLQLVQFIVLPWQVMHGLLQGVHTILVLSV